MWHVGNFREAILEEGIDMDDNMVEIYKLASQVGYYASVVEEEERKLRDHDSLFNSFRHYHCKVNLEFVSTQLKMTVDAFLNSIVANVDDAKNYTGGFKK
jgi:hypothetical protein